MADYFEEESSYESSQGSDLDEADQAWSDEEDGCDGSCSDDNYSMSEYGDDPAEAYPEPEPPDYSHGDTSYQGEYEGETESNISFNKGDECHGEETEGDDPEADQEGSWQEEADSEISLEEANEHEENFPKTEEVYEDVDGGEASFQSVKEEVGDESHAEGIPWCEVPYSDQEDEYQDETGSQTSVGNSEKNYGGKPDSQQDVAEEEEALSEAGRNDDQPGYVIFAGHHQGPEAYLCWEKDMEHWFDSNQVHEEDKTTIAEDTLTEDAFRKWEQDAYWRLAYDEPEATWQEMKELLYEEYVKGAGDELLNQIRVYTNLEPRRLILAKRPNRKAKLKNAHDLKLHQESTLIIKGATEHTTAARVSGVQGVPTPQAKTREISTKPLPKFHENKKPSKSSKSSKPVEFICYRCHEKGHFVVTCPTRLVVTSNSLEVNLDSTSEVISHLVCKFPTSGIMHLSCPKADYAGLNKDQEDVVSRLKQEEIIPEPDPQEGLKPATRNPLKLVDFSVQAHEEVQNNLNKLVCSVYNYSNANMICLSSPKRCDTVTSFSKGPMKQKKVILKRDDKAPPKEPSLLKHFSGKDGTTTSSILRRIPSSVHSPSTDPC
ncbi:hypothetical protein YC2023_035665 [Brassica napus]